VRIRASVEDRNGDAPAFGGSPCRRHIYGSQRNEIIGTNLLSDALG